MLNLTDKWNYEMQECVCGNFIATLEKVQRYVFGGDHGWAAN
jgi:hypothetical protein